MGNKTSNYLLSMDPKPTDRKSENVVGKLRANDILVLIAKKVVGAPVVMQGV